MPAVVCSKPSSRLGARALLNDPVHVETPELGLCLGRVLLITTLRAFLLKVLLSF